MLWKRPIYSASLHLFGENGSIDDQICVTGYGLTETSPISHVLLPQDTERKVGSVGILLPNMEARLVNELDESPSSTDADEGEPGELWLRGPNIMKVSFVF